MREVIWLAGADADLQANFDFLEERQPGRGLRFLDEINDELACLREYPEGRPKKPAPFRKQRIADSPYSIQTKRGASSFTPFLTCVRNRARFFADYSGAIPTIRVDERFHDKPLHA